ncbi:MAG: TatD family hydrolase, partial [Candidatus Hodarchaeales archaeon]
MSSFTDFHCHLHEREFNNVKVRERMALWSTMGITKIVAVSMDQKTALQTLHITDRSKKENWPIAIYPAIGIHPWEAHKEFDKQMLIKALDQAENPIVGEIGLDHRFVPEKRW